MTSMKSDTYMQRTKNRGLVYASATLMAASTALAFFGLKDCGGKPGFKEMPALCEPIRADGICCESESYPYLRNSDGTVAMKDGKPVENPAYTLEDCHRGDNVCQNQAKPEDVRDAAGRPVAKIMEKYLDGRPITLPLEGDDSQDCVMQAVKDAPCAVFDPANPSVIERPRITGTRIPHSMRQRGQEEIAEMHRHPESLAPGDNYFVVINNYEEVCAPEGALPICVPTSVTACACPNHVDCAPAKCGNGRIDQGEKCDQSAKETGCAKGQMCTGCSACRKVNKCGNGTVDSGEKCDPKAPKGSNGCAANETCAPGCNTCAGGETHSACRSDKCVSVPGAGESTCNTNEDCAPESEPTGPARTACRPEIKAKLTSRVSSAMNERAGQVRAAAGAGDGQPVLANVSITINQGKPTITGIRLQCSGCRGGTLAGGIVNFAGLEFDPSVTCYADLESGVSK
jgi:hypothetical protein